MSATATNGGLGGTAAVNAASARSASAASAAATPSGRAASDGKKGPSVKSSNYAGNSGKNTVGHAKDGTSGDWDKGRDNAAGDDSGKATKGKTLYGFQSTGPDRARVPAQAKDPKTKKRVSIKTEEADPDKAVTENKKKKINKATNDIATTGQLSHNRVGRAQKMASFGSHRRSFNWIQPGVAKAQLLGPFSDHMRFKQRVPQ
jgi:hypothetical protein